MSKDIQRLAEIFIDLQRFEEILRRFSEIQGCKNTGRDRQKAEEKIFLTYKGPRGKSIFKSRQEAQVEVGDFTGLSSHYSKASLAKR
jgi:adenylate cyclase class IV